MSAVTNWIADAKARLRDPMVTYKEDATVTLPLALEALEAVAKLHRAAPLHLLADDCEHRYDEDADSFESADGDWLCATCTTGEFMCPECTQNDASEIIYFPCPTFAALDSIFTRGGVIVARFDRSAVAS